MTLIIPSQFQLMAKYENIINIKNGNHYYVSNDGDDSNNGTSPELPWRTLEKVNTFNFQPGDTICFKCGDMWRGQLFPKSGSGSGNVKYTSYGMGNKPVILGSVAINDPLYWTDLGNNIWAAEPYIENVLDEMILNSSFDENDNRWSLYKKTANGADATGMQITSDYYEGTGCYSIELVNCGMAGSDLQFSTPGLSLEEGKIYRLSFAAKSTIKLTVNQITMFKGSSPYTSYVTQTYSPQITTGEWRSFTFYFKSTITATDARLVFMIGGLSQMGAMFYIDSISLKECEVPYLLDADVGNIIFDNGSEIGVKKWYELALCNQNDFWYDTDNQTLKVYSTKNPTSLNASIECALGKHIIIMTNCSYAEVEGLDIKYGGAHGIRAMSADHITIRNCDISFMGGCFLYVSGTKSYSNPAPEFYIPEELMCYQRHGNGIEFFNAAHDNIVENCNIWEIYDAAITNQATGENATYNIYYINNNMRNFEHGFEIWNRPASSTMHDIYFENNVLDNAGGGWSHDQRPDLQAAHLLMYNSTGSSSNIYIRNNTFNTTQQYCIYRDLSQWNGVESVIIDNNKYYIDTDKIFAKWQGINYAATTGGVSGYLDASGKDANSMIYIIY